MTTAFYNKIYDWLPSKEASGDVAVHLLSTTEKERIKAIEKKAIIIAGLLGALGVLALYLPYYLFPIWFDDLVINIKGNTINVPIKFWAFTVFWVILEIVLLTVLNLWLVKNLAMATSYNIMPNYKETLLQIGLEKKHKEINKFGINPYQDLNTKALLLFNLIFILKATLTNVFSKILIQRVLGRYAAKALQDFIGIPIFAFWNIWAIKQVIKNARVIILGRPVIEDAVTELVNKINTDHIEQYKNLVYDTLQFIAISKRDYHYNHFLLTQELIKKLNIEIKQEHILSEDYETKILKSDIHQSFFQKIIILGFILDGTISNREKKRIELLNKKGIISISYNELKLYMQSFTEGKSIAKLYN